MTNSYPRMIRAFDKPCHKVPHSTRKRAIKEADRMRAAHPDTVERGGTWRAYLCPHCQSWHTGRVWSIRTSHDLRQEAQV